VSLLGIDLGTSGVRAGAFRVDGTEISSRSTDSVVERVGDGRVEADAEAILGAVERVLRELTADEAVAADPITALAISVQGEAIVPVDATGRALAPAPLSMDRRGLEACDRITERMSAERLKHITGQPAHPMFSIYKIAASGGGWVDADGFRCLGDFVAARMGAAPAIDYSMAARTGAFDLDERAWSEEIVSAAAEYAGSWLTTSRFSRAVPSGTVIGTVSETASERTGLRAGTPIVAGAHDQAASFVGGGGRATLTSVFAFGSSDCLSVGSPTRNRALDDTGFATYPLTDSLWISLAGTAAGGWILAWFADLVGATSYEAMKELFSAPAPTAPRLLVLPYFAGSGTLDNDPGARGIIAGLTLSTTTADLARAFLESSGFELAKILELLSVCQVEVGAVNAVGGGAANGRALALRASAAGAPLSAVPGHSSARGAALIAGIGTGEYAGFDSLPNPGAGGVAVPDPNTRPWYDSQRAAFRALYQVMRPIDSALSAEKENNQ
jgi:Sugar (pentulose and hexulose) kinases